MPFLAPGRHAELFKERYEVVRILGAGKFADAALVKSLWDEKLYVAKTNKEKKYENSAVEMHAMLKLDHISKIEMKESFWHPSEDCFIMINHFCSYGSLASQIKTRIEARTRLRDRFPENLVRICLFDIASCLKHMKDEGWVHLNINPDNVLISEDGYFKVNNFGTSLILDDHEQVLTHKIGQHQPPEKRIGYFTDIYGLGVTIYALCQIN